jgi:DNA invertase Pin-like site-specific DNA recombinase
MCLQTEPVSIAFGVVQGAASKKSKSAQFKLFKVTMNQTPLLSAMAAVYGRVSTDKQTTETQEGRCKEYLQYKHLPIAPAAEFYDDDVSGSVAIWERPNGRLLRQRLETGDIKHLVVAKLDRLGRKATDLLKTVELLDSMGVILHIVDLGGDSLSTQGAAGRLMFTVLAGMAEYERELIRDRITKHLGAKRDRGELIGSVPYGFEAVETGEVTPKGVKIRKLVNNPEEQQWIRFMWQLRVQGHGYHTIAKRLNEMGVPTKNRGEVRRVLQGGNRKEDVVNTIITGRWQCGNVSGVLNNHTVQDWLEHQGQQKAA